jgi:ribokinase
VAQLEIPLDAVVEAVGRSGPTTHVVLNAAPFVPLPRPVLERIDTLVVNENEAASFVGVASAGIAGAQQMATTILGHGPRHVVVTLGSSGAVVASTGSCIHFPAPAVPVVDTTGAGDVLVGTLAALLADGLAPDVASSLAVERASASVSFPGARSGGAI